MSSETAGASPGTNLPSENTHRNTAAVLPTADVNSPKASQVILDQLAESITRRVGNGNGRRFLGFDAKTIVFVLFAVGAWAWAFYEKTEDKPTVKEVNAIVQVHSEKPHPPTLKRIEKNESIQRKNSDALIDLAAGQTAIKDNVQYIRDRMDRRSP